MPQTPRPDSKSPDAMQRVPVSPTLADALPEAPAPLTVGMNRRLVWMSILAIFVGLLAAPTAYLLIKLIYFFTGLFFHHRLSLAPSSPINHTIGLWVIAIPVIGGLIVGAMARWGAQAIRGHGLPEAMEQVLTNQSRIPARITFLKPLSSAIAIGAGGPFGAEGPIIATGGALGSLVGQMLRLTAMERKTLLAAGAAAGMAAVFSAPVSATLLAVELLLFEFRGRSMVPVALACATSTAFRYVLLGTGPVFAMAPVHAVGDAVLPVYALMGLILGLLSVFTTRVLYIVEDAFAKLPIHWMWWPALGGVVVGVVGVFAPQTLGVGYEMIRAIVNGQLGFTALALLCVMKFLSWSVALGSGTSGGTLAPMFIIGGALGGAMGAGVAQLFPGLGIDPGLAGLVGMAAMFAGATRAFLTSVVFAVEVTHQPDALLPLLAACGCAYLLSSVLMRNTIMTEKITRRGVRVPDEYSADPLAQIRVDSVCSRKLVTLNGTETLETVRAWLLGGAPDNFHQGYPVLDAEQRLIGVLTRRDFMALKVEPGTAVETLIKRAPVTLTGHHSLRDAADHMVRHDVGRLIVVDPRAPRKPIGILTRSDILKAHRRRLGEQSDRQRYLRLRRPGKRTAATPLAG